MKIILHMGQGKTGTTSLQQSLHDASGVLRAEGVLYPRFGPGHNCHHLLLGLCGSAHQLPRWTREALGGTEGVAAKARAAWAGMLDDIRRRPARLLILSSEYLLSRTDLQGKNTLAGLLAELSDDITPVIYIRHPVAAYRAAVQQSLKARDIFSPPGKSNLKQAILDVEAAFGRKPRLAAFDRKVLVDGDIVADFATRFLAPFVDASTLPRRNENVGLSAEAMVLMSELRAELGGTYEAARKVARLVPLLEDLDRSDPPVAPLTLLPEVAEAALRAASGHRWLVETGRLEIPDLDIARIDGAPAPDWMQTARLETLFPHDPDRLARLRAEIRRRRSAAGATGRGAKPSENTIPRIQDLLLRFLLGWLASREDRNTGAASRRPKDGGGSSQGDRNEDHSMGGKLDAGSHDRH